MAYASTIKLVVGDTLPELNFTLKDSNTAASGKTLDPEDSTTWAPIDVTGGRRDHSTFNYYNDSYHSIVWRV